MALLYKIILIISVAFICCICLFVAFIFLLIRALSGLDRDLNGWRARVATENARARNARNLSAVAPAPQPLVQAPVQKEAVFGGVNAFGLPIKGGGTGGAFKRRKTDYLVRRFKALF